MKLFHVFSVLLVVVLLSSCMSVHTADVTESAVAKVAAPVEEVSGADEFVLGDTASLALVAPAFPDKESEELANALPRFR